MLSPWFPWGLDRPNRRSFKKGLRSSSQPAVPQDSRNGWAILLLVPESERDVLQAVGVTNTTNAIFTPSVCAGSGVVVWEI